MWRGFVIKKFDDVANREKKMNLIIPVKKEEPDFKNCLWQAFITYF